jgi:hypothetical protein
MLTEAFINVVCDQCMKSEEEIELTATARGWDDRGIDEEIESLGWKIDNDGGHFCPNCQESEDNK